MKFNNLLSTLVLAALCSPAAAETSTHVTTPYKYIRLDKTKALVVMVDIQVGLLNIVRDQTPADFRNHYLAHAALGKLFSLPTIITTSAEVGPNGPVPKEVLAMNKNATIVQRAGEVNAWDSMEFRDAVRKTGRRQVILAGIATDVCTAFLALSLREAGYEVWANTDASGTFNARIAEEANARMRGAGVHTISWFAAVSELMRDWRSKPGAAELMPYFDQYLPEYGAVARGHGYAVQSGIIFPGQGLGL